MGDLANIVSRDEFYQTYRKFIECEKANEGFTSKAASLDTELSDLTKDNGEFFSLRSFVFSIVCQSPITVSEKLDILYDLTDMCTKFCDGIDFQSATMILNSLLRCHQVFIPLNELKTIAETVFGSKQTSGIISAYWTKKFISEIKYDLGKDKVVSLEEFLGTDTE